MESFIDSNFIADPNPHKFPLLWSSKAHRGINRVLRFTSYADIVQNLHAARYFVSHFCYYFYQHGFYKHDIRQRGIRRLYRGVDDSVDMFQTSKDVKDSGFIATSWAKTIALDFAKDNGVVLKFNVDDLPDDTPYVIIDQSLADHLVEKEVLLMPGKLTIVKGSHKHFIVTYKPSKIFISMFKNPLMMGGTDSPLANEVIPNIDLRRKYAVFYRAIEGRPVEVLASFRLPKTNKEVIPFFKKVIHPQEAYYDRILNLIPEYQDMVVRNKSNDTTDEERRALRKKLASYWPHIAIYNASVREVEHITYTEYDCLIDELDFDRSRTKEIKDRIAYAMRFCK